MQSWHKHVLFRCSPRRHHARPWTIRPVAEAAGERVVRDATSLLKASSDKTLADLRATLALRVAMERGPSHG